MATEAILAPAYAPLGDRFGRRPVILTLVVFWGLFAVGFGLVKSVLLAVVVRGCRKHVNLFRTLVELTRTKSACSQGLEC